MARALDVKFTPEARATILRFLGSIRDYEPTLTLMKGGTGSDSELRWSYGAYAPKNLEVLAPEFERLGHPLLYSVDGLLVAIPQTQFVSELDSKTLGLDEHGLMVLVREPGV
jgi:hypothetical protein